MKSALIIAVSLLTLSQNGSTTIESKVARKALKQFIVEQRKVDNDYQANLSRVVNQLIERLETAVRGQLRRGDLEDANRINAVIQEMKSRKQKPSESLRKKLIGTRWSWHKNVTNKHSASVFFSANRVRIMGLAQEPYQVTSGNSVVAGGMEFVFASNMRSFLVTTDNGAIRVCLRAK